jgi:hypothetical protein
MGAMDLEISVLQLILKMDNTLFVLSSSGLMDRLP